MNTGQFFKRHKEGGLTPRPSGRKGLGELNIKAELLLM